MQGLNISAFLAGWCTAFFTIHAIRLLRYSSRKSRFHRVLGWIFVIWALFNAKDIILTFPQCYTEQMLHYVLIVDGWSAITYAIFVNEILTPGWATPRRLMLHAAPFLFFTIVYIAVGTTQVVYAYVAYLWCYAWAIVIGGFLKARRYLRYIHDNYSNIDEIDVSWLRPVFFFAVVSQLMWLAVSLLGVVWADMLYYVSTVVMWLMVLHYSRRFHPVVIEPVPAMVPDSRADAKDGKPAVREYHFEQRLQQLVEQEEIYLKRDLTMSDLALAVGTNRTYLSNYLSQSVGMSFYDYVNQLRITKKSVPLMQEHPEYTLEHIAAESGFKSISTFRRAFVKLTGKSPSSFRQGEPACGTP